MQKNGICCVFIEYNSMSSHKTLSLPILTVPLRSSEETHDTEKLPLSQDQTQSEVSNLSLYVHYGA